MCDASYYSLPAKYKSTDLKDQTPNSYSILVPPRNGNVILGHIHSWSNLFFLFFSHRIFVQRLAEDMSQRSWCMAKFDCHPSCPVSPLQTLPGRLSASLRISSFLQSGLTVLTWNGCPMFATPFFWEHMAHTTLPVNSTWPGGYSSRHDTLPLN